MRQPSAGPGSARAYLQLFRLGNCAMGASGALLAAVICGGAEGLSEYTVEIVLTMLVVVLFIAAGNSLNDFYDRDIDKTAHPDRPIPAGLLTPSAAMSVAMVAFAISLVISIFLGAVPFAIVFASILMMVSYEERLKAEGVAGNVAISWLTGALFLFGGAAVESLDLAGILAALAFLATLGREIVKDVQDMEGDRSSRRTLPMRVGARSASFYAMIAFVAAVVLSPLPYVLDQLSLWYLPVVAVADAIFIYCALIQFGSPERGQKAAKLAMLVALVAFLVGGLT